MAVLGVDGVTLDALWNVSLAGLEERCFMSFDERNRPVPFDDYCAINLSERLIKAGFRMPSKSSSPYRQCHSHRQTAKEYEYHFLLAEQMANWLITKPVPGLPDVQKATGDDFEGRFNDKQGIIFFKDYWQEKGQGFEDRSGDHIDLWRNGRMPKAPDWVREIWELVPSWAFGLSHLENSKEVWFWELP